MIEENDFGRIYGQGWFETFCSYLKIKDLPKEEQIRLFRQEGIHGQTDFFRDEMVLAILDKVLQGMKKRAASVGCSDGKEVYSLFARFPNRFEYIHGYDCNPESIDIARNGYYWVGYHTRNKLIENNMKAIADVDEQTVQFRTGENVQFAVHDILEGPLPQKYDVITMLNVLCHYSADGIDVIAGNVSDSLNPRGWLVCETNSADSFVGDKAYVDQVSKSAREHGLVKQQTRILWWGSKTDMTCFSKVYRKS